MSSSEDPNPSTSNEATTHSEINSRDEGNSSNELNPIQHLRTPLSRLRLDEMQSYPRRESHLVKVKCSETINFWWAPFTENYENQGRGNAKSVSFAPLAMEYSISEESRSGSPDLRGSDTVYIPHPDTPRLETNVDLKRLQSLFSYLGYSIGLGSIWRFPYICYTHGGGTFLIPYLIFLFLSGIPVFCIETILGQFTSKGFIGIYDICPLLRGAGLAILIFNLICCAYYNIIITYAFHFLTFFLRYFQHWDMCGQGWSKQVCVDAYSVNNNTQGKGRGDVAVNQFLFSEVLNASNKLTIRIHVVWEMGVLLTATYVCLTALVLLGWRRVSRVLYITTILGYIMLLVLLISASTLPGAIVGIRAFFYPEWKSLLDLNIWVQAAIQVLYTTGTGFGIVLHRAKCGHIRHNFSIEVILVPLLSVVVSLISGYIVYSTLGYLSDGTGIPITLVGTASPALIFISYPLAIAKLPMTQFWNITIWGWFILAELGYVYVQFYTSLSSLYDLNPRIKYRRIVLLAGTIPTIFVISGLCITDSGIYILQLLDWYAASFSVCLVCFIEVFMVSWLYGADKFARLVEFILLKNLCCLCPFFWKIITPATLLFTFVSRIITDKPLSCDGMEFPAWTQMLGWLLSTIPITLVPGYAVYEVKQVKGPLKQRIKRALQPEVNFGPSDELYFLEWEIYSSRYPPVEWYKNICSYSKRHDTSFPPDSVSDDIL